MLIVLVHDRLVFLHCNLVKIAFTLLRTKYVETFFSFSFLLVSPASSWKALGGNTFVIIGCFQEILRTTRWLLLKGTAAYAFTIYTYRPFVVRVPQIDTLACVMQSSYVLVLGVPNVSTSDMGSGS